jgi:hypothetical protein
LGGPLAEDVQHSLMRSSPGCAVAEKPVRHGTRSLIKDLILENLAI